MEPFTFVVVFASIAGGVAAARVLSEYRQSNRQLRLIAVGRSNRAVNRFRSAAEALHR